MKSMSRLSKVSGAIALLTALAMPGIARADAYAQSILDISNFTFRAANGNATKSAASILPFITIQNATDTGDTSASLNGALPSTSNTTVPSGTGFVLSDCQGACGSFAPFTPLVSPAPPTATFVGSQSDLAGSALLAGAQARTGNTVSLVPGGQGTATGNVNLNADFTLIVNNAVGLEVDFNAAAFLRSYLTGPGTATSAYRWSISLTQNNNTIFEWAPFGLCGVGGCGPGGFAVGPGGFLGSAGGTIYADPFSLVNQRSTNTAGDSFLGPLSGTFQAESNVLAAGTYKLTIRQTSETDAELIPEPGTLALISVALLGSGAAMRRRQRRG